MDKELAGGLGDVEVVLKETLNGEQSLLIEAVYRAALEHLAHEHIAQGRGKLIDKSCDAEIVVADYGLFGVEHLADLEGYLSFLERTGKLLDAGDGRADADICVDIKVSCQRIGNGARELFEILGLDVAADFLDESYLVLVYVDDEILGLVREQILDNVERRGIVMLGDSYEKNGAHGIAVEAEFARLDSDIAGKYVVKNDVLDEVAPVEFLVVALLDVAQRHAADIRIFACKLIFAVNENSILGLHVRAERAVSAAVNDAVAVLRKNLRSVRDNLAYFAELTAGDYGAGLINNADRSVNSVAHLMDDTLEKPV